MTETRLTILHSSPLGSTGEIARWMAAQVPGAVAGEIGAAPLPPAGAILLAAPIRYDRWHRPMRDFAERHSPALAARPVAALFTCLSLSREGPQAERDGAKYRARVAELLPGVAPEQVGGFAGVLDFARFAWPMRPLVRGAMAGLGVREGDYRDWQALDSWLRDTVARLEKAT